MDRLKKLYSVEQARRLDQQAMAYGIAGIVLMENAGGGAARLIDEYVRKSPMRGDGKICIMAGPGNNGGDGYVIARHLHNCGYNVEVYRCVEESDVRGDAASNLAIWQKMGGVVHPCLDESALDQAASQLSRCAVLVDALLGTGLSRPVDGWMRQVLERLSRIDGPFRVAVDLPSGMHAETGHPMPLCFRADLTITFAMRKVGLWMPHAAAFVGQEVCVDIGAPKELIEAAVARCEVLEAEALRERWRPREQDTHKGSYGHVLVVAGSRGKLGAALLACLAVLRSGAGLCTLASEPAAVDAAEGRILEVMTERLVPWEGTFEQTETGRRGVELAEACRRGAELAEARDIMVIGPGLGQTAVTGSLLEALLGVQKPTVIDADGLNLLVGRVECLRARRAATILTPHPGEMARLCGCSTRDIQGDRLMYAKQLAENSGAIVVLKGARTLIATPTGKVWLNPTGHAGMATAGSGDVLAGLIGGLLAQGYKAEDSACLGVFLHGWAGDLWATRAAASALIASDLLAMWPQALAAFEQGADTLAQRADVFVTNATAHPTGGLGGQR